FRIAINQLTTPSSSSHNHSRSHQNPSKPRSLMLNHPLARTASLTVALLLITLLAASIKLGFGAQAPKQSVTSGQRYQRLVIRNAMVVDGNGTPAAGPKDIVIERNTIAEVVPL